VITPTDLGLGTSWAFVSSWSITCNHPVPKVNTSILLIINYVFSTKHRELWDFIPTIWDPSPRACTPTPFSLHVCPAPTSPYLTLHVPPCGGIWGRVSLGLHYPTCPTFAYMCVYVCACRYYRVTVIELHLYWNSITVGADNYSVAVAYM
jgi:hypothetical protein